MKILHESNYIWRMTAAKKQRKKQQISRMKIFTHEQILNIFEFRKHFSGNRQTIFVHHIAILRRHIGRRIQ